MGARTQQRAGVFTIGCQAYSGRRRSAREDRERALNAARLGADRAALP
jgi:hypothetical protein